jgi:hypothetical protein
MNMLVPIFLIILIGTMWQFPFASPILSIILVLFTLAIAISSIFKKHNQTENPRLKIAKDVLMLVFTLLLIIFLGGLAGMFANQYASPRFGAVGGFVSAILASFAVGYAVRWGMGQVGR